MGDNDIPSVVTFMTDALDRFRLEITSVMKDYATKAELELVRAEVRHEREMREALQKLVDAMESDRRSRGIRMWAGIWSAIALTITSAISLIAAHFHF